MKDLFLMLLSRKLTPHQRREAMARRATGDAE
jgi:hypothetical protein